jgi:hypothetical protein
MRIAGVLATAAAAATAGCLSDRPSAQTTMYHAAYRNLTEGVVRVVDNQKFKVQYYCWAHAAWRGLVKASPGKVFTADYRNGFLEGYVDYLDAGGNGEPPAVPPFCYRLVVFQNPPGHKEMEEWFAGFRHGSAAARATGQRELITLPITSPPLPPPTTQFADVPPQPSEGPTLPPPKPLAPAYPPQPPTEVLPAPRVLPPGLPGVRIIPVGPENEKTVNSPAP